MGDIEQSMPTTPPRSWQQGGGGAYGPARRRRRGYAEDGGGGEPDDPVSLHGVDPASITPDIQRLIDGLMEEIDTLRWRLAQAEHRQEFLEDLADQDSALPTVNRRAFLRHLGQFLERAAASPAPVPDGALVVIYLDNFEELRRAAGLPAAREALRHLARQVVGALRASDVVGSIGGAGLAALFTTGEPDGAWAKVDSLLATVAARPLTVDGVRLDLRPVAVRRPLEPGETAEVALAAAEARLRRTDR